MRLVDKSEWKDLLTKYWSTDPAIYTKWHVLGNGCLEDCVNVTLNDLTTVYSTFQLFEFEDENGFFGYEVLPDGAKYLTTFFIHPKSRKDNKKQTLWNVICETLGQGFKSALYVKNTRAIRFFLDNGASADSYGKSDEHNANYILFKF